MMTGARTQPRLLLAAVGNPLLDIIVRDEEERLVSSHSLERKVAQEVDTLATGLYDEVLAMPGVVTAGGGCSLNTARVFSWLAGPGTGTPACLSAAWARTRGPQVSATCPPTTATCCHVLPRSAEAAAAGARAHVSQCGAKPAHGPLHRPGPGGNQC